MHFLMTVIGDNIEEQLAPFQENNMGDCPEEYMEFQDTEYEMLKEYEEKDLEVLVKRALGNTFQLASLSYQTDWIYTWDHDVNDDEKEKDYIRSIVKYKKLFETFEDFARESHGMPERDKQHNRYGYWCNPNSQWDWYVIGGRWSGFFLVKPGREGRLGEPGTFGRSRQHSANYADQLVKGDIDFDRMKKEAYDQAMMTYTQVERAFGGKIPQIEYSWEKIRTHPDFKNKSTEEKQAIYTSQRGVEETKRIAKEMKAMATNADEKDALYAHPIMQWGFRIEDYQISATEFATRAANCRIVTYGMLKDGEWLTKDLFDDAENPWEAWVEFFNKEIEKLSNTTLITVVDCHV